MIRNSALALAGALALQPLFVEPAAAAGEAETRGRRLAVAACSSCHAVGPQGASPRRSAPPFRDLHKSRDLTALREDLAQGILPGHPDMPEIRFWPGEADDLVAYLMQLSVTSGD